MRRLSLRDIWLECFDEVESEDCIHSFGEMWVVDCPDGYWMCPKDVKGEIKFVPASPKFVTAINTRKAPSENIEAEEAEVFIAPIEVMGVEDYRMRRDFTGRGFPGMEGAFDTYSVSDFEL